MLEYLMVRTRRRRVPLVVRGTGRAPPPRAGSSRKGSEKLCPVGRAHSRGCQITELTEDVWIGASEINVTVAEGEIILTGTVEDRRAKRRAEDIADDPRESDAARHQRHLVGGGTDPRCDAPPTSVAALRWLAAAWRQSQIPTSARDRHRSHCLSSRRRSPAAWSSWVLQAPQPRHRRLQRPAFRWWLLRCPDCHRRPRGQARAGPQAR